MKKHFLVIIIILLASSKADRTLKECSHLSLVEGQYTNFYTSKNGLNCCMCPEGTFLERDCSANDPNSTICSPCQKKTFFPYGPHRTRECIPDDVHCKDELMTYIEGSPTSKSYCKCPPGMKNFKDLKCIDDGKRTQAPPSIAVLPFTTIRTSTIKPNESMTLPTTPEISVDPVTEAATVNSNYRYTSQNPDYKIKGDDRTVSTENPTYTNYTSKSPTSPGNDSILANAKNTVLNIKLIEEILMVILIVFLMAVGGCLVGLLIWCIGIFIYKKCCKKRKALPEETDPESESEPDDSGDTKKSNGAEIYIISPGEEKALLKAEDEKEEKSPYSSTSFTTVDENATKTNEATPLCEQNEQGTRREVTSQQPQPPQSPPNIDQHQCNCPRENDIPQSKNENGFPSRRHIIKRRNAIRKISHIIGERDLNHIASDLLYEGSEYEDMKKKYFGDTPETSRQVFKRVFEMKPRLTLWNLHHILRFNPTFQNIIAEEITGPWTEQEGGIEEQ